MKKLITLLATAILNDAFLIFNLPTAQAQIITTVAGNGTGGYSGDGGQATAAELYGPEGMAFDAAGNLYIADFADNVIRKINTLGIITTVAGNGYGATTSGGFSRDGGQATAAELYYPSDVAIDAEGNLYISDANNHRIRKVNTAGIITTIAGNGTVGYTGDGGPATNAGLQTVYGLLFDPAGNLYLTDEQHNVVRKINTAGIITTIAGNGTSGNSGNGGQATNAQLSAPARLAMDAIGNLYIVDVDNNNVRKINMAGIITTIAGNGTLSYSGDGGPATAAGLHAPDGITLDAAGNIYINDFGDNHVRMINTAGIITSIAGDGFNGFSGDGGPATVAELNGPVAVIFDTQGNLYISDNENSRIRKITNVVQAGIEQFSMQNEGFSIYPNPTNSMLNLSISQFDNLKMQDVEVTNTLGEFVYHCQIGSSSNCQIDVSGLQSGVYFVRVGATTQKFVKQ